MPKLLHNTESVLRPNLVFHPIKMILHRLLRQTKMIRNLFVRKPLRNQRHNLLLPPRQAQAVALDSQTAAAVPHPRKIETAPHKAHPDKPPSRHAQFRIARATSSAEASRHKYPLIPARTYCKKSASSFADPISKIFSPGARFRTARNLLQVRLNAFRETNTSTSTDFFANSGRREYCHPQWPPTSRDIFVLSQASRKVPRGPADSRQDADANFRAPQSAELEIEAAASDCVRDHRTVDRAALNLSSTAKVLQRSSLSISDCCWAHRFVPSSPLQSRSASRRISAARTRRPARKDGAIREP